MDARVVIPLTVLCDNEADAAEAREAGLHAVAELTTPPPGNVLVLSRKNGLARLRGLVDRGLPKAMARYRDTSGYGGIVDLLEAVAITDGRLFEGARDLYWHEERPLGDWDFPELEPGVTSGFTFLDPYLRWTAPEVCVIAGPYGCGKSSLARLLAIRWADLHGRHFDARASIVGWEDKGQIVRREVMRYAIDGRGENTPDDSQRVNDMLGRVGWTQRHSDERRLLSWYRDLMRHRAQHDGVRFFVFDPFNEHDQEKDARQSETDYVRDMMLEFRKVVHDIGAILIIVTHVSAKSYAEDGSPRPFRVANAAGSAQFGNKADRGICVLRTRKLRGDGIGPQDHMVIRFDKAKDEETMGKLGTVACNFDAPRMGITFDASATAEVQDLWS